MTPSSYTARANVSYLLARHPEWTNAQFAAALGASRSWVKKWRARLQEEHAAGIAVETTWQGHSRARKHPPSKTHPLIVDLVLSIRDHPPEGLRRVPGQLAIQYYLQRDPMVIFRPPCCALGPVWASRLRSVRLIIPNKTALSSAITAPIKRSASAWIGLPPWSKRKG